MKIKVLFLFVLFSFFFMNAQAQEVNISSLMTQLADGLKPEAFKGSWNKNKDQWMDKLDGLDISDFNGVSSQMTSLISNLKKSAFQKGVQKGLLAQLAKPGNAAGLTNVFKSLVNGINTDMFKPGFDKGNLLSQFSK